jgi:outer membrane protein insertion porin family
MQALGIPYLNSTVLPYVEQFFAGGAYSVRGFTSRFLGPGSFYEEESTYIDQSGDVKLEGNLEYRFGLSKVLKGAVFLDAGNIWLVNEDESRPGSKFEFDTFYQQLAIGTGRAFALISTFLCCGLIWVFPSEPHIYWMTVTGCWDPERHSPNRCFTWPLDIPFKCIY